MFLSLSVTDKSEEGGSCVPKSSSIKILLNQLLNYIVLLPSAMLLNDLDAEVLPQLFGDVNGGLHHSFSSHIALSYSLDRARHHLTHAGIKGIYMGLSERVFTIDLAYFEFGRAWSLEP